LVEALTEVITPFLDSKYAFFGYSMGAVIGFELARALRRKHGTGPQALFVAAHRAPQIKDPDPFTYDLPKEDFIRELHRLEGTPKAVLEHAELMELMLPLLRADFQLIQTYEYYAEPPLECPII